MNQEALKIRKFVFRIRKRYFDMIVAGTKKIEYRRDIPFWQTRLVNVFSKEAVQGNFQLSCSLSGIEAQAVFICGKRKHVRELTGVERLKTPEYFSEQGKKDVDTPTCLAFHLGEVV
ncbi:MAG: hypothetical protein WC325_09495 [Candidatus Bathyarchaeia archaeon]